MTKLGFVLRALDILIAQLGGAASAFKLRDFVRGVINRDGDVTVDDEIALEQYATDHIARLKAAIASKE